MVCTARRKKGVPPCSGSVVTSIVNVVRKYFFCDSSVLVRKDWFFPRRMAMHSVLDISEQRTIPYEYMRHQYSMSNELTFPWGELYLLYTLHFVLLRKKKFVIVRKEIRSDVKYAVRHKGRGKHINGVMNMGQKHGNGKHK